MGNKISISNYNFQNSIIISTFIEVEQHCHSSIDFQLDINSEISIINNTVLSHMRNLNQNKQPTAEVTYQPRIGSGDSHLTKRTKIILITITSLLILAGVTILIVSVSLRQARSKSTDSNARKVAKWDIHCRFDDAGKIQYLAGDVISGTIEILNNGLPELKLKSIDATLVGELDYTTEENISNRSTSSKHTLVVFEQWLIPRPVTNPGKIILPLGNHTWPFSIRLDHSLPPSIKKVNVSHPSIQYFIRVRMVRPEWYLMNLNKEFPIIIHRFSSSPAKVMAVEAEVKNRKDIQVYVKISKNVVAPGNKFVLDMELDNPKGIQIHHISAAFIQIWDIGDTKTERITLFNMHLEDTQRMRSKRFHRSFELYVPLRIPDTFSYILPDSRFRRPLVLHYALRVTVHASDNFSEIELTLPLVVTKTIQTVTDEY
ncbi:unnamed protein product [Rotaria magnacalcarata]|uniref:Arrestin C-terminal-like domain-containing protein n=1 Tax=Rotaria magnacalcarata TaxID=392030 RepID=A0A816UN34_9BILA|nr:unnamed protein product [Rotaria magnacalcarata]